jgi:hypothetical protein
LTGEGQGGGVKINNKKKKLDVLNVNAVLP